jgi:hypothetical protein
VRSLFARVFRWRFGIGWWLVVLFGLPVIASRSCGEVVRFDEESEAQREDVRLHVLVHVAALPQVFERLDVVALQ